MAQTEEGARTERGPEWWTTQTLRVGVFTSAVMVGAGFLLLMILPGLSYGLVTPTGIIKVGLLMLIATSILRVAATAIAFYLERDYSHATISTAVFVILVLSLVLGRAE